MRYIKRYSAFLAAGLVALAGLCGGALAQTQAQTADYTVNGAPVAREMGMLMEFYGFAPGAYYIDINGNYGVSGQPPQGNVSGGMVYGWTGVEPRTVAGNPYAEAYVNGVAGARIFWVYSPSIFSGATGGSSGYYHFCPGGRLYTSSEGAISVGGGNDPWAGVAGTSGNAGRWEVVSGMQGPELVGYHGNASQRVTLVTLLQGSWKVGQTKYAVEPGKASCY